VTNSLRIQESIGKGREEKIETNNQSHQIINDRDGKETQQITKGENSKEIGREVLVNVEDPPYEEEDQIMKGPTD